MCAPFWHTNPCRRRMPSSCCPKQQKHSNVQNSYSRKLVSQTKSPNIVELWRLNDLEKAPAPARPQRWNEWRRRRRNFSNQVSQASPYSPYSSFGSSKGPVFCKMRKKDLKKKVCQWLLADVKDVASTPMALMGRCPLQGATFSCWACEGMDIEVWRTGAAPSCGSSR